MIKYLTDLECIQFERLLLLRSKELSLSDQESHLLLLIYTFSSLRKKDDYTNAFYYSISSLNASRKWIIF